MLHNWQKSVVEFTDKLGTEAAAINEMYSLLSTASNGVYKGMYESILTTLGSLYEFETREELEVYAKREVIRTVWNIVFPEGELLDTSELDSLEDWSESSTNNNLQTMREEEQVVDGNPQTEELTVEEKLERMQEMLEEALAAGKKEVGTIVAGPDENYFYRVLIGGSESIHKLHLDVDPKLAIHGSEVVVCSNIIEFVVPENLGKELEKLDFDRVNWEDIRGLDSQIEEIKEAVEGPMRNRALYESFGLEASKGILLYGPSGTGKTMLAKAIATTVIGEEQIEPESFVYMKGGEMLSKWVGEAEGNIKNIFKKCREYTHRTGNKSILFIDEADALLPERGSRKSSDVETTIVPTFLAEMDGLNNNNPFVILATNHAGQLDKAIVRPGRIDLRIEVKRPSESDALQILDLYFSKTNCTDSKEELSRATLNCVLEDEVLTNSISGALLKNMVQKVTLSAIKRLIADGKTASGIILEDVATTFNK